MQVPCCAFTTIANTWRCGRVATVRLTMCRPMAARSRYVVLTSSALRVRVVIKYARAIAQLGVCAEHGRLGDQRNSEQGI